MIDAFGDWISILRFNVYIIMNFSQWDIRYILKQEVYKPRLMASSQTLINPELVKVDAQRRKQHTLEDSLLALWFVHAAVAVPGSVFRVGTQCSVAKLAVVRCNLEHVEKLGHLRGHVRLEQDATDPQGLGAMVDDLIDFIFFLFFSECPGGLVLDVSIGLSLCQQRVYTQAAKNTHLEDDLHDRLQSSTRVQGFKFFDHFAR